VELDVRAETRPADPIEVAAYCVVSEAAEAGQPDGGR
jgi:hypothetical protein